MKRFFRGVLTTLLTFLTVVLLMASLLFTYLAITGRASLFGYTFSLIEAEEGTAFVFLQTDAPDLQSEDIILQRSADGDLHYITVSHASGAVVYYYDSGDLLCSIPLTSPEFGGKLIGKSTLLGNILTAVSGEPGRWIVLGSAGGLLLLSLLLLILSAARRSRALRLAESAGRDDSLLQTFAPEEIEFEMPETPQEEGAEAKEDTEPKTYTQETSTLDLNELRKRMSEESEEKKDDTK